ncbi:hypothetical protein HYW46_07280 [Candidatus Daviesbacteria bacterium]|nr:hypothetical protein [Candidatus Daviesbacteria bacterium]
MLHIKKLAFAPVFLILFALTNYLLAPLLKSPMILFATDMPSIVTLLVQILTLSAILLLADLFFVVFAALAQDWRLIALVSAAAAAVPLILVPIQLGLVVAAGFSISVLLTYPLLAVKLKTYITFHPTELLSPAVKNLTLTMVFFISFAYFLSANSEISKNGFQVPDKLLDQLVNMSGSVTGVKLPGNTSVKGVRFLAQAPSLSKEQIELLKQYPDILKQYGIDPKTLDSLETPQSPQDKTTKRADNGAITKMLKDEIQNLIKPFTSWIPVTLASSLFSLMFLYEWLLSLFLSPVIWFIFWVFRKTGFVKFITEVREVKKMVV